MFDLVHKHYHHCDCSQSLSQQLEKIMSAIDDLKTAVAANASVTASAVTLINGISAQITAAIAAANAGDTAALSQLASDLSAQDTALAAAVTANTPAGP